ncbi:MAG: DUF1285 domain-containing protein [Alphaproteobacteria bacterium]
MSESTSKPHADQRPFDNVLAQAQSAIKRRGVAPVDKWNPDYCGEMDMRIARDGTWFHEGSPIGRKQLVRLFSTVLRKDEDGRHYLVTPVEKIGITVDDAPFLGVEVAVEGAGQDMSLSFRTNVDDQVTADADHPIRVTIDKETGEPSPYVLVRGRLEAKIARSVFYELVALGQEQAHEGAIHFGLWSGGIFHSFGEKDALFADTEIVTG